MSAHRIAGSDYASQRDRKLRIERQRRAEREAIRANGGTDTAAAPVTACPPQEAVGALHFGQRAGLKAGYRHASKRRFPAG